MLHKATNVTLYKGFHIKDGHAWCLDYDFGRVDEMVGKTFDLGIPDEELRLCKVGFHACDLLAKTKKYYPDAEAVVRYFRIKVPVAWYADATKYVFSRFTVEDCVDPIGLIGGLGNTGSVNTGGYNTGDFNRGDCNSGSNNVGRRNAGSSNTGNRNTGTWNTGSYNTGSFNLCDGSADFFAIETPNAKVLGFDSGTTHDEIHVYLFPGDWRRSLDALRKGIYALSAVPQPEWDAAVERYRVRITELGGLTS